MRKRKALRGGKQEIEIIEANCSEVDSGPRPFAIYSLPTLEGYKNIGCTDKGRKLALTTALSEGGEDASVLSAQLAISSEEDMETTTTRHI